MAAEKEGVDRLFTLNTRTSPEYGLKAKLALSHFCIYTPSHNEDEAIR